MCFPSPFESIRDIASALSSSRSGANRDRKSTHTGQDSATPTDRAALKLEKKILKAKLKFEKREAKELKKAEKKREKERRKEMSDAKKGQPTITAEYGGTDGQDRSQNSESLGSRVGNGSDNHWGCRFHGCAGGPESEDGAETPVSLTH